MPLGLIGFSAATLVWLGFLARTLRDIRLTPVERPVGPEPSSGATVSILVPARNEAERILVESLESMLAQDWPALEVIVVDDRSTDDTLAILRELEATHPRLRVIAGVEPPPGWCGKVHALRQAEQAATGDWICGTDADILYHPATIRRALAAAERTGADLVTFIPGGDSPSRAVDLVLPISIWMILRLLPPPATNNPRDPRALGCGGFLFLRRSALEAIGGYAAVAGEVVDDVGLATRFKQAGYRLLCAQAPELIRTPMYTSLRELHLGFAKNAWQGMRRRLHVAVGSVLAQVVGGVLPAAAVLGLLPVVLAGGRDWRPTLLAAAAAWLAQTACFVPVFAQARLPRWYAVAAPFGVAVMAGVIADSTRRGLTGAQTLWRGRAVPAARRSGGAARRGGG